MTTTITPESTDTVTIDVRGSGPVSRLARALSLAAACTDPKSTRYALGAIVFDSGEATIHVCGTDGRRLAACDTGISSEALREAGIPRQRLVTIPPAVARKLRGKTVDCIQLEFEVSVGVETRTSRSEERPGLKITWHGRSGEHSVSLPYSDGGRFPDWRGVIPDLNDHTSVTFNAASWLRSLDRAEATQREAGYDFFLGGGGGSMSRPEQREPLDFSFSGTVPDGGLTTCLDITMLRDFLQHVPGGDRSGHNALLYVKDQHQAVVAKNAGGDLTFVQMPLDISRR